MKNLIRVITITAALVAGAAALTWAVSTGVIALNGRPGFGAANLNQGVAQAVNRAAQLATNSIDYLELVLSGFMAFIEFTAWAVIRWMGQVRRLSKCVLLIVIGTSLALVSNNTHPVLFLLGLAILSCGHTTRCGFNAWLAMKRARRAWLTRC